MKIKEDLTSKKFGKLLVISRDKSKIGLERGSFWNCLCDCGTNKSISRHSLVNHGTLSCGCYQKQRASEGKSLDGDQASKNAWLKKYKARAKKFKIKFEFTNEEFFYICEKECFYCGDLPIERDVYTYIRMNCTEALRYKANGIDRVNPKLGYTKLNTVPCCTTCNLMKTDKSQEEFINKAISIAKRFGR